MTGRRWRRQIVTGSGLAGTAAIVVLVVIRGPELAEALAAASVPAVLAAIAVHAATLACRCEAWRLAVGSIDDRPLRRLAAHAAGGAGSVAGMLQGAGTAPVRAVALRRLAADACPSTVKLIVAELPIFAIEATLIVLLVAVALPTLPQMPAWATPAALAATLATLAGLRLATARARDGSASNGLRVLGDRHRRGPVVALLVAVTALGVVRAWIILLGFGLPHDFGTACLTFVSLGVFGLLPIGPGSTPVAILAVAGTGDPTVALAAGLAVTATSWAGTGFYAGAGAALWAVGRSRAASGSRSASSVDQPNWRAARPSPSSGL